MAFAALSERLLLTLSERLLLTLSERLLLPFSERLLLPLETSTNGPVWPGTGGVVDDTAIDVESPAARTAPSRVSPTLSHQIAVAGVIRLVRNGTSIPMRHTPRPAQAAALQSDAASIRNVLSFDASVGPFYGESPALTPGKWRNLHTSRIRHRYGCMITSPHMRPLLRELIGYFLCFFQECRLQRDSGVFQAAPE